MKFMLLPWKPELVFTGVSIMGVNPQNLKFNSHVVSILSCQEMDFFSMNMNDQNIMWCGSCNH
jgi:hypothetical protein